MNKPSLKYLPVLLYSFLLVGVWLVSWIIGVAGLLHSGVESVSLLSASGVRWALRTAISSLEAAPWGVAVLCVVAVGLLSGSGILETLRIVLSQQPLSHNRRPAAIMTSILFLLWCLLLGVCVVLQWRPLAGITQHYSSSPLVAGALPLAFIVVFTISALHGAVSGCYRSLTDVLDGVCKAFALFLPAFIAMLPASGIIPSLSFLGVSIQHNLLVFLLYIFPFVIILCTLMRGNVDDTHLYEKD